MKKSEDAEGNEEENGFTCTDYQVDEVRYDTSCKKTCQGKNCNNDYENPLLDSRIPSCLVCSVTVDPNNQTIGIGDERCWEGTDQRGLVEACPEGQKVRLTHYPFNK